MWQAGQHLSLSDRGPASKIVMLDDLLSPVIQHDIVIRSVPYRLTLPLLNGFSASNLYPLANFPRQ